MSYDDGKLEDERRLPMETYRELYKGHEVACHTACHPTISRCPLEQVVEEVMDDRKEL